MMRFDLITLFPEILTALNYGIVGRAQQNALIEIHSWNPRDYAQDTYKTVDDRPYGGGPGMVMKFEPLEQAILAAKNAHPTVPRIIYLSPQGHLFKQAHAKQLSQYPRLILIAGRYEGIDERIIQTYVDEEWSIGDYVLSGGEIPMMVMIDTIVRLIPGVIGHEHAIDEESFAHDLLEYPHYTRPEKIAGLSVPKVLLSGNHETISQWRLQQALIRTWQRRPDLLANKLLSDKEKKLLETGKAQLGDTNNEKFIDRSD